ncbi:MAG: hypothetical protein DYH20_03015 [Gammaproteobacteria bacterium PRO9]|nr:hypothetical protein [Gammaproteobacteria bacterium PRO9]
MIRRLDAAIAIACLAAGAVVAVPRHASFARHNRAAEVSALSLGAATAARLAHIRWLEAGEPPTIEGARGIVAMRNGYPSVATLPLMLADSETVAFAYDNGRWRHRDVADGNDCGVVYRTPVASGGSPVVEAETAGC